MARPDLPQWAIQQRIQVGDRIRNLRVGRQWSQEQLAEASGLSRFTIYRTELGTHAASIDSMALIAHALDTSTDRLFRDD